MDTLHDSSTDTNNSINEATATSNIRAPDEKVISEESFWLKCQEIQIGKFKFLPSLKSDHIMVTATQNGFRFDVPSMNKTPPRFELKTELITQVLSYFSSSLCVILVEMDLKGSEKIRDKLDVCDSAIFCGEPEYKDNVDTFFILSPQSFDDRNSISDYLLNTFSVHKSISNVKVAESLFKNFIPNNDANPQKVKIVAIKVHSEKDLDEDESSVEGKSMSFKVTQSKHLVRCDDIPSSIGDAQIKVKRKTIFCYAIRNRSFEIKTADEKSSIFVWLNPNGIFFQIPDFNSIQSVTISRADIVEISGYISYEFFVRFFTIVVTDECIRRIYSQLGLEKLEKSDIIIDKMFNRIVFIIECSESASYAIAVQKYFMSEFELSYKYTILEPNEATKIFKECTPHKGLPFKQLLPPRPAVPAGIFQLKLVMLFCSSIRIGLRQYLAPESPPYLIVRMSRNKFYFKFPRVKKGFEKPLFVEMNDITHIYGHVCCCVPFISLKLSQICSERIKRELGLPYNKDVRNFYDGKQLRITFEICCHKKFKLCKEAKYFLRESVQIVESQESECQENTEKGKNKTLFFPSQAEPYVKTDRIVRLEKRLKRKICEGTADEPKVVLKRLHFVEQLVKTNHILKLGKGLPEEHSEENVKQLKTVTETLDISCVDGKFMGKDIASSSSVPGSAKESCGNNSPCSEKQSSETMLRDVKQEPEDDSESSNSNSKHSFILPDVQIENSNTNDYENVEKILGNIDHPQVKKEPVDNDKACQNGYTATVTDTQPHPSPSTQPKDQTINKTNSKCFNLPSNLKNLIMSKNASIKVVNVSPNNPQQPKVYKFHPSMYNSKVINMSNSKNTPFTGANSPQALSRPIRFVNTTIAPKNTPQINAPVASNLPRPSVTHSQSSFKSIFAQSSSSVQFKPLPTQGNHRSIVMVKPSTVLNSSPSTSSPSMPFKVQSIIINRNRNSLQNQAMPQNLPSNVILKPLSSLPKQVQSQLAQGSNAVFLKKTFSPSESPSSAKPMLSQLLTNALISPNATINNTSQSNKSPQFNDTGQSTSNSSVNRTEVSNRIVSYTTSVGNSDAKAPNRAFNRPISVTKLIDKAKPSIISYLPGNTQLPSTVKRKLQSLDNKSARQFASKCLDRLQQESNNSSQWTKEEENTVLEAYQSCGEQWSLIAELLGGRTASEIKEYYMSNLNRGNRRKSARISQRYADRNKRHLELKKRLLQQIAEGTEPQLRIVLKRLDVRSLKSTFKVRYLTSEDGVLSIPKPTQSSSDDNQHSKINPPYKIKYVPVHKTVMRKSVISVQPSRSNSTSSSENKLSSVKFINNNQLNQNKNITSISQPPKSIRPSNVVILPTTLKPLINYGGSSITQPTYSNPSHISTVSTVNRTIVNPKPLINFGGTSVTQSTYSNPSHGSTVNRSIVKHNPLIHTVVNPLSQHTYNRSFPGLNKAILQSKPIMALKSCALANPSCSGSSYGQTVNKALLKPVVPYLKVNTSNLCKSTCNNSPSNTTVTKTFVKIVSPLVTAKGGSFILPSSSNSSYDTTVNKTIVKPINPLTTVSSGSFILPTGSNSPYDVTVNRSIVKPANSSVNNSSTSLIGQPAVDQSILTSSNSNNVNSDEDSTDDGIIASDFLEVVLEEKEEESNEEIPPVQEIEPPSPVLLPPNDSSGQVQYILPSLNSNNIISQPFFNQQQFSSSHFIIPDKTVLTSTFINNPLQQNTEEPTKPFIKYCSQHWEAMKECNPNLSMKELLYAFKYMWEVLTPQFKQTYIDACENEKIKLPSTIQFQNLPKCAIPRSSPSRPVQKVSQANVIKTTLGTQTTAVTTEASQSSENSQPLKLNQNLPYQENDTSTSSSESDDDDEELSKFLEFQSSFIKKVGLGTAPRAKIVLEELDPALLRKRREIIRRQEENPTKSEE